VQPKWWQSGIIYQVYPRSFQDTNGDGVGDLPGITRRLPHLVELGVDAIWISPIFPSPMADFGYDVADYTGIHPLFGTLEDFDELLAHAHALGLKVLLDLVPNHSSDQHPWFVESRSSRYSPKRDWYIWRDPAPDGGPPTNWLSEFGGPAWEYDPASGQYYYHAFLAGQPDLNWRNPEVASAIHSAMRIWLERGVDGFRVDVIWHMIKDAEFRDNPENPHFQPGMPPHNKVLPLYTTNLPEVHDVIAGLRKVVDDFPERLLIGEIYLPFEKLMAYYGADLSGAHLPFNFALLDAEWHARQIAHLVDAYEGLLPQGGWPNWVLGNHDKPRVASRVGPDQVRVAAMLLLTLRGTPTIYYGEEVGMEQVPISPDLVQDPFEKNVPGIGVGRDGSRTPMQWDASDFAGFSTTEPWLPLAPDWRDRNVAAQRADPDSLYGLYRRLTAERRVRAALNIGAYRPISASGDLLIYAREHAGERLVVALNLGGSGLAVAFPNCDFRGHVIVGTRISREGDAISRGIDLSPNEGLIIELDHEAELPDRVPE
jgi:alpha-glucosidase